MAVKIRKPNGYWTYNNCAIEALKYHTKIEFEKYSYQAYYISKKNNWLNEFYCK